MASDIFAQHRMAEVGSEIQFAVVTLYDRRAEYFSDGRIWNNIRSVLPDFIVSFCSAVLIALIRFKIILQKINVEDGKKPPQYREPFRQVGWLIVVIHQSWTIST